MQATQLDTDMFAWADGTRHYRAADGTFRAVEATLLGDEVIPAGAQPMVEEAVTLIGQGRKIQTVVMRPTVVFECAEDGSAIDMTPVGRFPAGTSHEDALAELGYTVA